MNNIGEWIIMKSCRAANDFCADATDAYIGPTELLAGASMGRVYTNRSEAAIDASLLSELNPVGFTVVRIS